jgi:P4 family phage/plasmid primase-like protien
MIDKMIRYIGGCVPELLHCPDLYRINLLNGVYNINETEDRVLSPQDASYLTTTQIPINFDPSATCPAWDKFLSEIFPEGVTLLQEIIGLCMIPFTSLQKCIVLLGTGSNGKGVFLRGLQAAIGVDNICNVPLNKLSGPQERFNTASLVGKLVNVFGDLPVKNIQDASQFKALTGEDTVTVEYKGKQPFSYKPFCRLIFSCAKKVESEEDKSIGYQRRLLHIPFVRQFELNPKVGQDLSEILSSPNELSGLFNKIRKLLPNLITNGFTFTPDIAALIDNYISIPPITQSWLKATFVEDENSYVPARAFYSYYAVHCPLPDSTESRDHRTTCVMCIRGVFPDVIANITTRFWKGVSPIKAYKGIRFIDPSIATEVLDHAYTIATYDQSLNQREEGEESVT